MPGMSQVWLRNGVNVSHLLLTLVMAWCAILLFLPGETLHSSGSYSWFVQHWPYNEMGWACLFAIATIIGFIGLFSRNRWIRLACAVLLGSAHGELAYGIYESNPLSTGTGTYALLATLSVWRIWVEGLIR